MNKHTSQIFILSKNVMFFLYKIVAALIVIMTRRIFGQYNVYHCATNKSSSNWPDHPIHKKNHKTQNRISP